MTIELRDTQPVIDISAPPDIEVVVQGDGQDGRTILSGARAPVASDGVDGDFWMNTTSGGRVLHGPKEAGAWPAGVNLAGGGGGSSGSVQVSVAAAETLSALKAVTFAADGARAFDPSTGSSWGRCDGITITAATAGTAITVATTGTVDISGAGFTAGAIYFAGAGGALVATPPASGLIVPVGHAVDSDTFYLHITNGFEQ